MMYGYYGNMFGGGLMMIFFWIAIIWLIIWLARKSHWNSTDKSSKNNALDILKERYAKGEINKQEFEEKKKDLTA